MESSAEPVFASRDIAEFARLVCKADDRPTFSFVRRALANGHSLEAVHLSLLQPVARRLGDLWLQDRCDFVTVTLGLCRLHDVVRECSPAFQSEIERRDTGHHALLTTTGGEQHSFGLVMVGEFLRRAGWAVSNGPFGTRRALGEAVGNESFTLIGFSLSCDSSLDALATEIRTVRRRSLNPRIWVMVGGRLFIDHPELVARIGADATATDAHQAVLIAQNLSKTTAARRA